MCIVDMNMAMSRIPMSQTYRNGKAFPGQSRDVDSVQKGINYLFFLPDD